MLVYGKDPRKETAEWRKGAIESLEEYKRDVEAEGGRYGQFDENQQNLIAEADARIKACEDADKPKPEKEKPVVPEKPKREIVVRLTTIDHYHKRGKFKTLEGARKFAHRYVGPHPDISATFGYAVGAYGDAKITWEGCTAAELFPEPEAPKTAGPDDDYYDDGP